MGKPAWVQIPQVSKFFFKKQIIHSTNKKHNFYNILLYNGYNIFDDNINKSSFYISVFSRKSNAINFIDKKIFFMQIKA